MDALLIDALADPPRKRVHPAGEHVVQHRAQGLEPHLETLDQILRVDELQRRTIRLEKEISEEEARTQEGVADTQMVELSHVLSESGGEWDTAKVMEPAMEEKRERMKRVLERADGLRLEALKGVVEILRPMQAVHFLIAAAELHLRVHEYGMRKDVEDGEVGSRGRRQHHRWGQEQ